MKKNWKRWTLALAAALCLSLLAGCGEAPEAVNALELRAGISALPLSGDPAMETDMDGQTVLLHLYEGLMKKSADASGAVTMLPGVARSYDEDISFDGTVTYTFKLRDNAKWSDGQSVTAEDFVFAWQRLVNPATGSPYHELLRMLKGYDAVRAGGDVASLGVRAKNENTLVVELAYRCPYFLSDICTAVATVPLREDVVAQESWAGQLAGLMTDGTYQVVQTTSDELSLSRNTDYYDNKTPGPTALTFRVLEPDAAWDAYKAGELDAVAALPQEQLVERTKGSVWTSMASEAETYTIVFNNIAAPLDDSLVRQALSLAIDRSALPAMVGTGITAAEGLVPPGIAGKDGEDFRTAGGAVLDTLAEDYEENCSKAAQLLSQSAYTGGAAFPALEYLYVATPESTAAAQVVQNMWRDALRVNVTLRAVTSEELNAALASGAFDMAAVAITSPVNDAMGYLEDFKSDCKDNVADYSNSAFNTLVEVIRSASDETARMGLLHDAEQLLLDDACIAPLYVQWNSWEIRTGLTGAFRDTLGRLYLYNTAVDVNA